MRHAYFGRKLSRTKNERRRLFQGLARELFKHGEIQTSLAKAKAVQPLVEKLITLAKRSGQQGKIKILQVLADKNLTKRLLDEAKTRFSSRSSGFTRIVKLGIRQGDGTQKALLGFVDKAAETLILAPKVKAVKSDMAVETKKVKEKLVVKSRKKMKAGKK